MSENGLGPTAFPSLARMESEVIDIGLSLLRAPDEAIGNMTSGGTESIFLAVKSCRDWARSHRPDIKRPNVVAPRSAHPAFDKAAAYLGMDVIRVPLSEALTADIAQTERAITADTVMLIGSAPCFPFGLIDPIADLNDLAIAKSLWLHVDACVGGYFAPFARMNGAPIPDFDFALAGVQSMSADLHKYGYAAKGASTVLYREPERHRFQSFDFDDWPCRAMSTPTFAGTRPGGAIAAAWAVLNYLGIAGYRRHARTVTDTRAEMQRRVQTLGLRTHGQPELGLLAFGGDDVDILSVGEELRARGWVSSRTVNPNGIHLMLSPAHANVIDQYMEDLAEAVELARAGTLKAGSIENVRYA